MKINLKSLLIPLLLFLTPCILEAKAQFEEKMAAEVRIKNASTEKELYISYLYGEIELVFWNKKDILLKYEEAVTASSQQEAKRMLETRTASHNESDDTYMLYLGNKKPLPSDNYSYIAIAGGYTQKMIEEAYNCKWTVYVPRTLKAIAIRNTYGTINVGEGYEGQLHINVIHSDVNITSAMGMCMINMVQGKFNIKKCGYLNLTTLYANGTIGYAQMLNLGPQHSENVEVKQADYLNLSGEYSKVYIDNVQDIKMTSLHSDIEIGKVANSAILNKMEHSTVHITNLYNRFDAYQLKNTKLDTSIAKDCNALNFCARDNSLTDVTVNIPSDMKVSCLLTAIAGKTHLNLNSSVKQRVVRNQKDGQQIHTLLNTTTFTPTSVIDVYNNYLGEIKIFSY
jgi:hypothetical protein